MKKLFYILFLSVLCLTGCYEDKGNYDYNPIPPIELSGLEPEYTVYAMVDVLDIVPQFAGKEDCDCLWTLFLAGNPQAEVDTLSTEPDLHHKVVESSGTYTLVLTITNRKTGDKQLFQSSVTVQTEYATGCYILKEVDGQTDVDLMTPNQDLLENILAGNETRIAGKPRSFVVCSDINYVDEEGGTHERVKTVWITSDQDARMLPLENMQPVYDLHTMFYEEQPNESPRNMQFVANNLNYFSNNGCYNLALLIPTAMHKFGLPLEVSNASAGEAKDCACSKYVFSSMLYSMFYDEKNERFLTCLNGVLCRFSDRDKYGNPTMSPNNMNSDLIYLCKTQANAYAVMFDKGQQQHVVYKLETNAYDVYGTELYSPLLEKKELSAGAKLPQGETFGYNLQNAFIYFSKGSTLNMFDYNTMQEQADILPGLEGDITLIKHIQGANKEGQSYEYLVVGTSQGGRYKLYFCEMLAGKPDLSKTPKIIEGEGAPKDIYIL